ncbi:MAG TPA: hypothetical protein VLA37_11850, partial [Sphingomonadaceae bacterium]|nr:hypothetical protein [Sphingomonadaceae bacterium]
EATAFLHTRGFLRYARLVVDERLDPDQLPWLPADELWNRDYLSAEEAEQIVDIALAMQIISMLKRPE